MSDTTTFLSLIDRSLMVCLFGQQVSDLEIHSDTSQLGSLYESQIVSALIFGALIDGKCHRLSTPTLTLVPDTAQEVIGCPEFDGFKMWTLRKGTPIVTLQQRVAPVEQIIEAISPMRPRFPNLGYKLYVYQDGDYGGSYVGVYNTSVTLVEEQVNDKMSSFELEPGRSVIFYIDANYGYELFRCPSADYPNTENPSVRPQDNDKMSSFRIFADPNFQYQI